jgi:hypothetical protein
MSQPWKLLPLAAIVAVIGALLVVPGGVVRPDPADAAYDCTTKHPFQISIRDLDNGNNPAGQPGIVVKVSPDPQAAEGGGSRDYVDNGNNDDSNNVALIRENEACEANSGSLYTATIISYPASYDCDSVVGTQTFQLINNTADPVELYVGNCTTTTPTPTGTLTATVTPTATGTITATPGAAATVTTSASPATIGCSGTSIVTIQVRDSAGNPVPAGTAVTISTTLGSVSPSSGQTTDASGNAFVFVTGPASQGGVAVVTAKSGSAQGSTNVTINCGATATATTAPPPTVAPGGGVISPPNTGDAGLKDGGTSGWTAFAGLGLLLAASFGAVGIVKMRA